MTRIPVEPRTNTPAYWEKARAQRIKAGKLKLGDWVFINYGHRPYVRTLACISGIWDGGVYVDCILQNGKERTVGTWLIEKATALDRIAYEAVEEEAK